MPNIVHEEINYLNLMRRIKEKGEVRKDATGVSTKALFGQRVEFDISERIPLVSTKEISSKNLLVELMFFISGSTNTKLLEAQGVTTWKKLTSAERLKEKGLAYLIGDMGPLLGFQMRHWGAEYKGMENSYDGEGVDQLERVIQTIKTDPFGTNHIISLWNINDMDKTVCSSDACHIQFNVSNDNRQLDCLIAVKSIDLFIELPRVMFFYSVLTHMISHICNLKPRTLTINMGDAKLYSNHGDAVNRQLQRTPLPLSTLRFRNPERILNISDFNIENIEICGYTSWPVLNVK
jgi:thymidylate synthase